MSPTARVIIFSWSPNLHLQIAKLNLSNFTVTSPFNREINYTCIGSHSSHKQNQKIAKLNMKHTHKKTLLLLFSLNIGITIIQFAIFKPMNMEETIEFDVKTSFASRPVSRLISCYNKPDDITKEF